MPRLFSYVVDHDHGYSPNPEDGVCTLARCKYRKSILKPSNIVELAEAGDWIVGTGGTSRESTERGTLLYAMRVDEKLRLQAYLDLWPNRYDANPFENGESADARFCLVSRHFFYFGCNAIPVASIPTEHLDHPLEKKGPGFRSDFSAEFVMAFARWMNAAYEVGTHGSPKSPKKASYGFSTDIRQRGRC